MMTNVPNIHSWQCRRLQKFGKLLELKTIVVNVKSKQMKIQTILFLCATMVACNTPQHEKTETPDQEPQEQIVIEKHFIRKTSTRSPQVVIDSLKSGIEKRGLSIFTEVPHHKGAGKVGLELPITHVIIFGNPKVGAKLMLCDQQVGYELPLKILVALNKDGETSISYRNPKQYALHYEMDGCLEILDKVSNMLDRLTEEVI